MHNATRLAAADATATSIAASPKSELPTSQFCVTSFEDILYISRVLYLKPQNLSYNFMYPCSSTQQTTCNVSVRLYNVVQT